MKLTPEVPLRFKGPCGGFSQLTSLLRTSLSLSAVEERGCWISKDPLESHGLCWPTLTESHNLSEPPE